MSVEEQFAIDHADGFRLSFAQARGELGDDLVFLVNLRLAQARGEPTLECFQREVFLEAEVPDVLKVIVEEASAEGTFWVLVYGVKGDISAMQMEISRTEEQSPTEE